MSQERAFVENLLGQRFNFLLVFFSITVAGAVNARDSVLQAFVLTMGGVISLFLKLAIGRAQQKLDLILDLLFKDENHPAALIDKMAEGRASQRRLIGYWIPSLCFAALAGSAALAWLLIVKEWHLK